jgi:phospholipid/cholesterol/gamma-HCH transport system ATP-binding protein
MSANSTSQPGVRLEVRGLYKSYAGQAALKGVELTINAGEIFVIMGPSGSGKSVLLKHMIGLEQPDSGDILIEGKSILGSDDVANRFRLAMVFQSGALFSSLTVGENVSLYLTEHRIKPRSEIARIVAEKLAVVGLKDVENKYPSELSGGMKKRVAIARALVADPQLILYDEPTSELDPMIAITIAEEILRLNRRTGVTSVVVTHDRELCFGIAHRIGMINDGRILATGTPAEIKASTNPLIQKFLKAEYTSNHNLNS